MHYDSLEYQVSKATLDLLAATTDHELTIQEIIAKLPKVMILPKESLEPSDTRPGELLFEQIVRNIVSHKSSEGNFIYEGLIERPRRGVLKITPLGLSTILSAA